jgi:hypothetical protein
MRDIVKSARDYLYSRSEITALVSDRIYCNWYPDNPKGQQAFPFLVVRLNAGSLNNESPDIRDTGLEFRCYTDPETADAEITASNMDLALMDVLVNGDPTPYGFGYFINTAIGRSFEDPDFKWIYVLSEYDAQVVS